jgi:LysM repeat protein
MGVRPRHLALVGAIAVSSACSATVSSGGNATDDSVSITSSATSEPLATAPTTVAPTTVPPTTTTTTLPPLDVYDPACVVAVAPGESLSLIADRFDDDTVRAATIKAENDLASDLITPGQLLDVCVDNGLDDRTGEERQENQALVAEATKDAVKLQQTKLNELFDGYGIAPLLVDGISGSVTRQRLCAARLGLGLPVTTLDLVPGSEEEQAIMAAPGLTIPFTTAIDSPRWVLIDQTCQIMFVGEGVDRIQFIFPTSTGEPGYETRPQNRSRVYRYDPAFDNAGWHNSTDFPVPEDNPLNGNMYKPLYFDGGQAIHGANNVPTSPQSKGCARLRVEHQDALVAWLGLAEITQPVGGSSINLTVNVQGAFVPPA